MGHIFRPTKWSEHIFILILLDYPYAIISNMESACIRIFGDRMERLVHTELASMYTDKVGIPIHMHKKSITYRSHHHFYLQILCVTFTRTYILFPSVNVDLEVIDYKTSKSLFNFVIYRENKKFATLPSHLRWSYDLSLNFFS